MRGWFQFGYDGFPSGERRKRFFRQRDDPCGSEDDDDDYDDETNDRPVYCYPLRRSEEGSSSSWGVPSEEEADIDRALGAPPPVPMHAHAVLYESSPALYGASLVEFKGQPSRKDGQGGGQYVLWHGGASVVEPWVLDGFSLAHLTSPSPHSGSGAGGGPYPSAVTYAPIPADASLEDLLHAPLSHPALRGCLVEVERLYGDWNYAPPRFGHCAAPVELPSELARALLTEGLPDPTVDEAGRIVCPPVEAFLSSAVPNKEDYELHLSFVIGGTSRLPAAASPSSSQREPGGSSWVVRQRQSDLRRTTFPSSPSSSLRSRSPLLVGGSGAGAMDGYADARAMSHTRSTTFSRPALCFTLLRKPGRLGGGAAHWTRSFDLSGSSRLFVEPRVFATLTPWPWTPGGGDSAGGHTLSFLYLGGTETGLAPAPLFPLTVIQLDYRAWQWSARVLQAFGAEPCPRFGHSTTYCDGSFLVFGGVGRDTGFLSDLHILHGRTRVWREVFVPMGVGLPPRAFHCSQLLMGASSGEGGGKNGLRGDNLSSVAAFFRGEKEREGAAAAKAAGSSAEGVSPPTEEADCLTERPTGAHLLLCGGEGQGGAEPSVWLCALDTATWQPCHFPLLSRPQSYHVGEAPFSSFAENDDDDGGEEESRPPRARGEVRRSLSASKLQETIRALMERQQQRRQGEERHRCGWESSNASSPSTALETQPQAAATAAALPHAMPTEAFVSTVHGSLAQCVALPTSLGGGVLLLGGTRSPPVLLATQLQPSRGTLKELAAFWLLSSSHSLSSRILRESAFYYWQILGCSDFRGYIWGVMRGARTSQRSTASSLPRIMAEAAEEEGKARTETVSEAMAETNRLVSQGALDEQMAVWMRSAKRRLREERMV